MESLNKFSKAGYLYQVPSLTDKTYFFTRHTETETEQLWIQLKKTPEVEYTINFKKAELGKQVSSLVTDFITELGFANYKIKEE